MDLIRICWQICLQLNVYLTTYFIIVGYIYWKFIEDFRNTTKIFGYQIQDSFFFLESVTIGTFSINNGIVMMFFKPQ